MLTAVCEYKQSNEFKNFPNEYEMIFFIRFDQNMKFSN